MLMMVLKMVRWSKVLCYEVRFSLVLYCEALEKNAVSKTSLVIIVNHQCTMTYFVVVVFGVGVVSVVVVVVAVLSLSLSSKGTTSCGAKHQSLPAGLGNQTTPPSTC
jgi:hypothetical protein